MPSKWAVMKEGRKTALKVCDCIEDAQTFIDEAEKDGDKMSIEERKGCDKKCIDYCPCSTFCHYFKSQTISESEE